MVQERKLQQQAEAWERTLQCSPLPDVAQPTALHAYFAEAASREHKDIASVLHTCQVGKRARATACDAWT